MANVFKRVIFHFRISIDALQSLGNSAQTKASDHLLNIDREHNNKQYERIVNLYHGCESEDKHIRHYGDSRMSPFHGSPIEQEHASQLRPRVAGLVTEIEERSKSGFRIPTAGGAHVHTNVYI